VMLNITDCELSREEVDTQISRALGSSDCDFVEALMEICYWLMTKKCYTWDRNR